MISATSPCERLATRIKMRTEQCSWRALLLICFSKYCLGSAVGRILNHVTESPRHLKNDTKIYCKCCCASLCQGEKHVKGNEITGFSLQRTTMRKLGLQRDSMLARHPGILPRHNCKSQGHLMDKG